MPVSKAHIRATTKFEHNNYDKITLRLRKDGEITRAHVQEAADQAGQSLNSFILDALKEKMSKT
jgi:uncharacterized protein (DUF1778 family)